MIPDTVQVKVSAAMARQRFHGCAPDYIRDVCGAACCRSSTAPAGIVVTIHRTERAAIEALGGIVDDGFLRPVARRCPFQDPIGLCGVHLAGGKPFGCVASPFTLNRNRTLVVRNRYRLLRCYKDDRDGPAPPAYVAFRGSLDRLFTPVIAAALCAHLDDGGGDVNVPMPRDVFQMLVDNDHAKAAATTGVAS